MKEADRSWIGKLELNLSSNDLYRILMPHCSCCRYKHDDLGGSGRVVYVRPIIRAITPSVLKWSVKYTALPMSGYIGGPGISSNDLTWKKDFHLFRSVLEFFWDICISSAHTSNIPISNYAFSEDNWTLYPSLSGISMAKCFLSKS